MIKKWACLLNMRAQTVLALRYFYRGSTWSAIAHFGSELAESQGLDGKAVTRARMVGGLCSDVFTLPVQVSP